MDNLNMIVSIVIDVIIVWYAVLIWQDKAKPSKPYGIAGILIAVLSAVSLVLLVYSGNFNIVQNWDSFLTPIIWAAFGALEFYKLKEQ